MTDIINRASDVGYSIREVICNMLDIENNMNDVTHKMCQEAGS